MPKKRKADVGRLVEAFRDLASLPPEKRMEFYEAIRIEGVSTVIANTAHCFDARVPIEKLRIGLDGDISLRDPKVFLSHSSSDKSIVRVVANALRSSDVSVWIDEVELNVGDSLVAKLASGLRDSDLVVAFISPAAVASEWVMREVESATYREFSEKRVVVLPVLLGNATMPPFLEGKKFADFRDESKFRVELSSLVNAVQKHFAALPR